MWYFDGGTSTHDIPDIYSHQFSPIVRAHPDNTYTGIDHKSKDVLYIVESENPLADAFPQSLVVDPRIVLLKQLPELGNMPWVRNSYLEVGALLIALEAKEILSHHHLYRVNHRLMLSEVRFEIRPESIAIGGGERDRCSDIQIMKEVCNM